MSDPVFCGRTLPMRRAKIHLRRKMENNVVEKFESVTGNWQVTHGILTV
jgi:hypothetical protein